MMTNVYLRNKWISFFKSKGHIDVSNRSLIPDSGDKSLLFINSGIAAIKSYFCGESKPPGARLVSCQKVIRTGDIESIGESYRHHTYFEMLGNFSIGDYFKSEAIAWAWEFLTKELEISSEHLYVTIYSEDTESLTEWQKWIDKSRIILGSKKTNFWDLGVGPCGPCTEIYFDRGIEYDPEHIGLDLLRKDIENQRYLEIWNIVFSEFLNVDGEIVHNLTKNIDTGAGLERLVSVLEGKSNNFETSLFTPITSFLSCQFDIPIEKCYAAADYLRTSCLLLNEPISFGNKGREFVLRKIFRKAIVLLSFPSLSETFFSKLVSTITKTLPYYSWSTTSIINSMLSEYLSFLNIYQNSAEHLGILIDKYSDTKIIPSKEIFKLVTQYGLDFHYIKLALSDSGFLFSEEEFQDFIEKHKKISTNNSLSSAFVKKCPSLLEFKEATDFDYESSDMESRIVAIFDDKYNRLDVLSKGEEGFIVLDKTNVFPLSGGQDEDLGFIDGTEIINSIKAPYGQVLHKLKPPKPEGYSVGDFVNIKHDKQKRKSLEIHHTLEHLFFELLKREVHEDITRYSGNKYEDYFSIEVLVPSSAKDVKKNSFDLLSLDKKLSELISQELKVETSYISFDQYKKLNLSSKFEDVYEKSRDKLRFVDIGGYSRELCVGTHVRNTKELEDFMIVSFKKKQSNIYKFKVIGGKELVSELLNKHNCSRQQYLSSLISDPVVDSAKRSNKSEIHHWVEELLGRPEKILISEEPIPESIALSVFKALGTRIKNRTIFVCYSDNPNSEVGCKFLMISDLLDVQSFISELKTKYGYKGGGNKQFGSGHSSDRPSTLKRKVTQILQTIV